MNLRKRFAILLLLLSGWNYVYADEGLWMIHELREQNIARMKELGFAPDYRFLYDREDPCMADAVVIFGGGCSGITVSESGLIFTNHHCGYASLQKLSSVENDYLKDGFVARDGADEMPVEGLNVRYLRETVDVTDSIIPLIAHLDDEYRRILAADSIGEEIVKSFGQDRFTDAEILPFYNRNRYYLVVYDVYRDVRLVFAPPSSLGKFGGDTDNWMWPRHTCDFSAFRVYAGDDNLPADYDENNRPYQPKFVAEISLQGYREKDFAMTIGFPGSTDRYLSSWGTLQRIESVNKPRIEVRGIKQHIWQKAMQRDDAIRIKYASKYAASSNYWKNSIGMNRGLIRRDVILRKQQQEEAFDKWVRATGKTDVYGDVLNSLREGYRATDSERKYLTYLTEAFVYGAEIIHLARIFGQIDNHNLSASEIEEIMNDRIRPFFKDYDPGTDRRTLAAMMKIVRERVPAAYLPDIYPEIDRKYKGDYERYAGDLFRKTAILSEEKMIELLKDSKKYDRYTKKDPAIQLSMSILMTIMEAAHSLGEAEYEITKGERLYFSGLQEMYPDSLFYSDANFTMRLSYGSIGGYRPFDAAWYDYFTTATGLLEKEDAANDDFCLQPEIIDRIAGRDFGKYAGENGNLHLCFLSNNDITGGNSGSPVFDKNGRVIGLAFDGNWEAMSGDIAFETELQRTIGVDIRYILWIIERWGNCPRIIDELKIRS
jgi:hypothetical protein